ncbi:hypothetical protein BC938DRAFT_483013 [Jimgerdemannia flammicorona]|uniref:SHSP domain-containing protein n=1 Tax=Jimgerdemannia flammicorona TaxID=994334 RepID=A0A433QCW6_9FUNG|nr:hypothetical protein BC938DRAFT_483013 [Jimgerdemannia flammicorona]
MMVERTFHAARGGTVNFMAANYFRTKHLVSYTLMKQPVVEPSRGRVAIDNEAESYLIVLHTPGIDKKDLSIAVRDGNDEVTIEGNCHHDNEVGNVLVQTLAAGTFAVRVELPTKVHVNPVFKLDIQNGVTKIALTKSIPKRRRLLKGVKLKYATDDFCADSKIIRLSRVVPQSVFWPVMRFGARSICAARRA